MGILDDAIREHLDLKRKHGARETELREIEDEAFGSAEQPDPFTAGDLLTEVGPAGAAQAEAALAEPGEAEAGNEEPTRLVEPPSALPPEDEALDLEADLELPDDPLGTPEGLTPVPGQEELPGQDQIPGQEDLLEQAPADEAHDVGAPDIEEAEAPSESLEDLIAEEEPFPEDVAAPPSPPETAERPAPEDEPEEEPEALAEPESAVPEPPPPPPESGPEPPGRARGRVDVPTQEHPPPGDTGDLPPVGSEPEFRPEPFQPDEDLPAEEGLAADEPFDPDEPLPPDQPLDEPESPSGGPALYDFETDEDPISGGRSGPATEDDAFDALGPAEEEAPYLEEEEPYPEETASGTGSAPDEPSMGSGRQTFEEEEAEDLWFEKGPPQDFDFEE